jgi:hypothetical protein
MKLYARIALNWLMSSMAGDTSATNRFWNKYEKISAIGTAGAAKFASSSASTTQVTMPTTAPVRCNSTGRPVTAAASAMVAIGPGAQPILPAGKSGAPG